MLDGVGSSLKMVKFLLQHFWMLQDVARVWPAPSQHLTTRSNNVARCWVEMLRAFGWAFMSELILYHSTLIIVLCNTLYGTDLPEVLYMIKSYNYFLKGTGRCCVITNNLHIAVY